VGLPASVPPSLGRLGTGVPAASDNRTAVIALGTRTDIIGGRDGPLVAECLGTRVMPQLVSF
jgi:hypothetical protein